MRERAAEIVRQHLQMDPKFTISSWQLQRAPFFRQENPRLQFILDALRAAGVPE